MKQFTCHMSTVSLLLCSSTKHVYLMSLDENRQTDRHGFVQQVCAPLLLFHFDAVPLSFLFLSSQLDNESSSPQVKAVVFTCGLFCQTLWECRVIDYYWFIPFLKGRVTKVRLTKITQGARGITKYKTHQAERAGDRGRERESEWEKSSVTELHIWIAHRQQKCQNVEKAKVQFAYRSTGRKALLRN